MILVRWLARTWSALSAPPPVPLPGPRALPSYARMGRYIAGGVALDPRIDLLVRQLAAELSGCRWCVEHGLHRWRQAFLPVAELGALRRYAASPLFSARGRAARPASCGLRYAEPLVTGRKRPVLESPGGRWLLLIHQLPPKPDYFRVKIWRRLQRIGAVAIKNSVYVLPHTEQASEDFQWLRREIVAGGGEASVCQAAFVDGLSDGQIEALFRAQRDAEYGELARAAAEVAGGSGNGGERDSSGELARLERRLGEIAALDHFGAPGRRAAEAALTRARDRSKPARRSRTSAARPARPARPLHGRTWVTPSGVHVDRIASAWLIRRFIDPKARFRFVASHDARTAPGELRFDMFEAEYTHEGDRCTFETLVARFGLTDAGLAVIGELVHDIDCKDGKFGRGAAVLDDLYEAFRGMGLGH